MSLEEDRTTRDYLYGRLLAVADYIEEISLIDSEKNRPTNASRIMQRFATNPATTWPILYERLKSYMSRLKVTPKRSKRLVELENTIGNIKSNFKSVEEFNDNSPLSGEYLLAYYCQRKELWKGKEKDIATDQSDD